MNEVQKSIIYWPNHKSLLRKRMSNYNRAAQFAPFAALNGFDEMIKEKARRVDDKIELSEDELFTLNEKFKKFKEIVETTNKAEIIYFIKDKKKNGGHYIDKLINIKGIDEVYRVITTSENEKISFDDIYDIYLD